MPCHRISLLLVLMFITESFSQQAETPLQQVYDRYKNFDYQGVIKSGDQIIKTARNLSRQDSLEIFRLQGLSYYSMTDMSGALHCFISMLRMEPAYQMQIRDNPPKVINFFEEIKRDLIKSRKEGELNKEEHSGAQKKLSDPESEEFDLKKRNRAIGYSLILPGLGHLNSGQTGKGWILLTSGLITLGSSVFFTIDANNKEDDYLEATSVEEIDRKYSDFNQAYKYRNASYLLYAGIWMYTQMDLLFWSKPDHHKISIFPGHRYPGYSTLTVQIIF
jgi:hypothetical protein